MMTRVLLAPAILALTSTLAFAQGGGMCGDNGGSSPNGAEMSSPGFWDDLCPLEDLQECVQWLDGGDPFDLPCEQWLDMPPPECPICWGGAWGEDPDDCPWLD